MSTTFEEQWLSDLPDDWVEKRADFLCDSYRVTVDPSQFGDDLVAHYSIPQVQETGGPVVEPASDIDSSKLLVTSDTLLVSKLNPRKRTICIAKPHDEHPTVASGEFVAIKSDKIDQSYAYYLWCSEKVTDRLSAIVQSVTRSHQRVNPSDIQKLPWKWPPLETQRRIAQFLDEKTARIDGLIEKKRALLDRLAEKRQALITRAVTKGLNPAAPMKPSGIDWLGDIPAHWDVRGLTKCTTRVDYRGATPTKSAEGVFLVTARNIKNGQIDYEVSQEFIPEEEYAHVMRRGKPKIGEVLFTTEAPLGEVARVDNEGIALAQRIIKFSSSIEQLTNDYIAYWMYSSLFQRDVLSRATGSTALGIKASKIVELKCLLPPEVEQKEISDLLGADAEKRNDVIKENGKSIALLEEYRSAVITAAVTGQIGGLQ